MQRFAFAHIQMNAERVCVCVRVQTLEPQMNLQKQLLSIQQETRSQSLFTLGAERSPVV